MNRKAITVKRRENRRDTNGDECYELHVGSHHLADVCIVYAIDCIGLHCFTGCCSAMIFAANGSALAVGDMVDRQDKRLASCDPNRAAMVTRAALTLWCHYYPEGEWGWMVLISGSMSILLTTGFQLSFPARSFYNASSSISDWPTSLHQQGTAACLPFSKRRNKNPSRFSDSMLCFCANMFFFLFICGRQWVIFHCNTT